MKINSASQDINNVITPTSNDISKFLGIVLFTSIVKMPNVRMYWNESVGLDIIRNTMSVNNFEKIRSNFHFNNNHNQVTDPQANGFDKLHKLRPVLDELGECFLSVPMEEYLSVDEQICASKARHRLKQYMSLKSHKWGYKLFVLCGVSGLAYKVEIYTGIENVASKRENCEPNIGASGNVVIRLCREVPRNCNHKIFFDTCFTSLPLVAYFASQGILSLGTARRNRIKNCELPSEDEMKQKPRGTIVEYVAHHGGIDIVNVLRKDNKCVTLLSTFVGSEPMLSVKRYDRKKNNITSSVSRYYFPVQPSYGWCRPVSIVVRYKIVLRSKKWRVSATKCLNRNKTMNLADFKMEVATVLCMTGKQTLGKRGRPSELNQQFAEKKKKVPATHIPPSDIRLDQMQHLPEWNDKRQRCKITGCSRYFFVAFGKCGVHLCFNKNKNCFKKFHTV
ncbi:hypothetical protein PR048_031949 [Dryococelus australis]|uniref:PiggyBac transposable element-derived protein domain-containing protein n=1 Tax=Dryococelus australis TaxID=614101 RepID=A0ABQ9G6Q7_9NEOP|nr:hypothetical protein PR048_031949 [Dryococelus australis]